MSISSYVGSEDLFSISLASFLALSFASFIAIVLGSGRSGTFIFSEGSSVLGAESATFSRNTSAKDTASLDFSNRR